MRIPSGKTDQAIYFVAVDATDYVTRETGLSGFTVYRSRNGAAEVAYTTPTITEIDTTNMPGVYALLVDEDTTIASGSDSEEYCLHITCTGMAPVTRTIELYRRDTTSGRTLDVTANGNAGIDWGNIDNPTTAVNLSGTNIDADQVVASVTGAVGSVTGNVGGNVTGSVGSVAAGGITASSIADAAIDRAAFAADTGLQSIRSGTAQAGAAGSITLDASASSTTDYYDGANIYLTGGAGAGQHRICTAYNGTTKVATITPNWATTPDNTTTFAVLPNGHVNLTAITGSAVSTTTAQLGVNAVQAGGTAWGSGAITAASIASNAITSAKIATDAIGATQIADNAIDAGAIATGAITSAKFAAGAITSTVIATDAIGASQIAADAIGSSELAASAVTEIQSGLSTLDAAGVRTAVGLASANLDTQIADLPTANENADALLDRSNAIETGVTPRGLMRLMGAVLAGKISGAGTGTEVFRNTVADSKDRITATVDNDGNRTAITADMT